MESLQIANGLQSVFEDRRSFLVIGLTGRTGSGCTTVSDILATSKLRLSRAHIPPRNHEDRKHRIVHDWTANNWKPFKQIQVSHVITYFALRESFDDIQHFVAQLAPSVNLSAIKKEICDAISVLASLQGILEINERFSPDLVKNAYEFIFNQLPHLSRLLKKQMGNGKGRDYTKVFQTLGDNVRSTGRAFSADKDISGLFSIPNAIIKMIDIGKSFNRLNNISENYFVVDALRHPFEVRHLRNIIPSFYVFSVGTDEVTRINRLHEHCNLTSQEIAELDQKEYPKRNKSLTEYPGFVSQDIQACVDLADVHISNVGTTKSKDRSSLTAQVARYVALMQHPGLVTPTSDERCMQTAYTAKLNSGCISRQVGAVVTNYEGAIQAIGWNDVPRGQVPCLLRNTMEAVNGGQEDPVAYSKFEIQNEEFSKHLEEFNLGSVKEKQYKGHNITFCFKATYNSLMHNSNQVHTRSLHAEENAFLQISKYGGQAIKGGNLYTTSSPCELCAKKAYQLGIRSIYYIEPYSGISNDHVLASGSEVPKLVLFSGAIGRAYDDLYNPIMPYKDELRAMIIPVMKK